MNEKQNELIEQSVKTVECYKTKIDEVKIEEYSKIPLEKLNALGIAFQPLQAIFQNLCGNVGQSGLYRVTVPAESSGAHLVRFNDGSGFMGGVKIAGNPDFSAQARLNPLVFDPTMLCIAIAVMTINNKLDKIEATQKEILEFLQQKEKAKLRGNLIVLEDILKEYRFNWNISQFKINKHIQVQEIKRDAEQSIVFGREQIEKELNKKSLIHSDRNVKNKIGNIQSKFKDYELALYTFSFASYLEVMLLENFDKGYLNAVSEKIEQYNSLYRELYSKSYELIEGDSTTSVQAYVLKGVAVINKSLGKAIAKIPKISEGQVDENLISTGEKVDNFNLKRSENTMKIFAESEELSNQTFLDNINALNKIHNEPVELLVDNGNLYLK